MKKDNLWPPQTLGEALAYYTESDFVNCIEYAEKMGRNIDKPGEAERQKERRLYLARQFKYSFIPDEDVMKVFDITPEEYATL